MKHLTITSLFSLLLVLACVTFARAQDVAPEATPDAPIVISVDPSAPTDPLAVIVGLTLAFLTGVSVTLIAVAGFAKSVMNDPVKMMLAERLGNSIPVEMGRDMAASLGTIAAFVSAATDHIPEASKPETVVGVKTTPDMFTSTPTQSL